MPGEATNPDEQTYQFVAQKNLRMAQDTVRKITSNVQTALELAISAIGENVNQINNWVKDTIEE